MQGMTIAEREEYDLPPSGHHAKRVLASILLVLLLLTLPSPRARASNDLRLWLKATLTHALGKKLSFDLSQRIRFDDNISALQNTSPEFALTFRPTSFLSLKGGYRFIIEPVHQDEGTSLDLWHRFFGNITLSARIKPMTLSYRLQFQEEFGWPDDGSGLTSSRTLRNKGLIRWQVSAPVALFISGEFFHTFGKKLRIDDKWRATGGTALRIDDNTYQFFYRAEGVHNSQKNSLAHIIGIEFLHRL